MGLLDFFSQEAGQARRRWLDENAQGLLDDAAYYIGPHAMNRVTGLLGIGDMLNPVSDIGRAGASSRIVFDPGRTATERTAAAGSMLTDMASVLAPVAGAAYADDAARGLTEALANLSMPADDALTRFAAADDGAIRAWHGTKGDFDRLSVDETPNGYLWFSSDKGYAEGLAGRTNLSRRNVGSLYEVDLNIKNPLEINVPDEARRVADEIGVDPSSMSPAELEDLIRGGSNFESLVDIYQPQMDAGGHDAIAFRDTLDGYGRMTDQFVVFRDELVSAVKKYGFAGAASLFGMSSAEVSSVLQGPTE